MRSLATVMLAIALSACSITGDNGVESAPYHLYAADEENNIEIRRYESMILVSAATEDGYNGAFRKLFNYISGENQGPRSIDMTAPVFIADASQGQNIAMTAPVFMNTNADEPSMSFVMPSHFTLDSTPVPMDPTLTVTEVTNHKVAAIRFSGTLRDGNVDKHTDILLRWMSDNGYSQRGAPIKAGYNGPLTLPFLRHNEVLIEIH